MRMTSERKAETRERILAAAGALFRSHGIDAVGVDAIMHQAGLTHGGFYAHFASKEALVAEVSAASLARSAARWERISQEADPATALARIVDSYLDPAHVAAVEHGCVLATLGPEMARRQDARPAITARSGGCSMRWRAACRGGGASARWRRCPPWSARSCWRACATIRGWPVNFLPRRARRPGLR